MKHIHFSISMNFAPTIKKTFYQELVFFVNSN